MVAYLVNVIVVYLDLTRNQAFQQVTDVVNMQDDIPQKNFKQGSTTTPLDQRRIENINITETIKQVLQEIVLVGHFLHHIKKI